MLRQFNFQTCFLILFTCVFFSRISHSVSITPSVGRLLPSLGLDKQRHVVIGPVTNLTVLWKGHNSIVLSWLPAQVFVNHDIVEPADIKPGDKIPGTKMKEHLTLVAQNKTDDSPDSDKDSISSKGLPVLGSLSQAFKKTIKWLGQPLNPEDEQAWECKPFSYFADYTVGLRNVIAVDMASPVIRLRDSDWVKRQELKFDNTQALVPFSEGCLEHFKVTWQEVTPERKLLAEQSMLILPTVRLANITDLKPATSYRFSVIAQYKSDKKLTKHPEIYIRTASLNETEECECEWPGTAGDSRTCDTTPGAKYCTCDQGYEGDFCEECAPGFYRTAPHFPCHACPCNMHGTHRTTCKYVEGFLKCTACEIGYEGSMCHRCAKGFYRYRKYCVPCHCNGNTPNNANQMCLPTTGMCRNCQYNTTGFHCEYCLKGYVGSAKSYKKCVLPIDAPGGEALSTKPKPESGMSAGVVITITMLVLLAIAAVGFLIFRKYQTWRRRKGPAFWTVGMSPNGDAVDINSVHNHDARLEDEDDDYKQGAVDNVDYKEGWGGGKTSNKYLRLMEDA